MSSPALARVLLATLVLVAAACSSEPSKAYDPRALPTGPVGKAIEYGHDIIVDTPHLMKGYVHAKMSCEACHLNAGTKPRGGSFVGTYARFPQWNRRAHRVIALQDRLAECFLYSMNGQPPAYASKAMIALVAYIAWLSRGTGIGAAESNADRYLGPLPQRKPDIARGGAIYAQKCVTCHQSNGAGINGAFPPLWGATSFNAGAGMAHIDRMTGFVRYNMPQNAPGSLTVGDAFDVSAFVLAHHRPSFARRVLVLQVPRPAGFY
ncbi:MAG: c-type cytochrome [Candidatus Tumulicola sp.]